MNRIPLTTVQLAIYDDMERYRQIVSGLELKRKSNEDYNLIGLCGYPLHTTIARSRDDKVISTISSSEDDILIISLPFVLKAETYHVYTTQTEFKLFPQWAYYQLINSEITRKQYLMWVEHQVSEEGKEKLKLIKKQVRQFKKAQRSFEE